MCLQGRQVILRYRSGPKTHPPRCFGVAQREGTGPPVCRERHNACRPAPNGLGEGDPRFQRERAGIPDGCGEAVRDFRRLYCPVLFVGDDRPRYLEFLGGEARG